MFRSATTIEYNLVERVAITGELLSLKSSGNLVRGNTFVDIHGAVQGRHGCNNTFLNNTLIGGKTVLRAYGDNHRLIGSRWSGSISWSSPGDVTQDALAQGRRPRHASGGARSMGGGQYSSSREDGL